jgi:hypothetical protein
MTNIYHNNDSGGSVFQPNPGPPIGRLDRVSPPANPRVNALETHLRIGGEHDGKR